MVALLLTTSSAYSLTLHSARLGPARATSAVMAEGGPPQIDWQGAHVVSNSQLARGTMQLRLKAEAHHGYKAGHILGFEMAHPESGEGLKGPYTVTRPVGEDAFDIIYRVRCSRCERLPPASAPTPPLPTHVGTYVVAGDPRRPQDAFHGAAA